MFGLDLKDLKQDLMIAELKKQRGDAKCLTLVVVLPESDELEVKQYRENILTHLAALEARNKELYQLWQERSDSALQQNLDMKKEEVQILFNENKKLKEENELLKMSITNFETENAVLKDSFQRNETKKVKTVFEPKKTKKVATTKSKKNVRK